MSEHLENDQREPADEVRARSPEEDTTPELTGHPVVDEVLRSMSGLQERPVEEHVAVFEAAHEGLRTALAQADDPAAGPADS